MADATGAGIVVDALQYSNWNRSLFEEWRVGGLHAVHVTVAYWETARDTLSRLGRWHQRFREHADLIRPACSAVDIVAAKAEGRTAVILGAQNCSPIEDDLSLVSVFRTAGLMIMQLTYNNQSLIGAGCYEADDAGISRFGRKVIAEMNRVGQVIDLSHSAERTSREAIDLSARPVAITHANPSSFHAALRNKSDDLLKALAARGGMLGFSLYPLHLRDGGACTRRAFCEMVARTAELIGIDHIGIGSDTCRNWGYQELEWMRSGRWTIEADYGEGSAAAPDWPAQPSWFRSPAQMPEIAAGLREAGMSAADLAKVMGGNWLRFFAEAFEPAA
jgi:microsomal dipeptidase-like Zn-dependent dipeptidase